MRHPLHRGAGEAKDFYASDSLVIAVAAGIALIPNAPLGLMHHGCPGPGGGVQSPGRAQWGNYPFAEL